MSFFAYFRKVELEFVNQFELKQFLYRKCEHIAKLHFHQITVQLNVVWVHARGGTALNFSFPRQVRYRAGSSTKNARTHFSLVVNFGDEPKNTFLNSFSRKKVSM